MNRSITEAHSTAVEMMKKMHIDEIGSIKQRGADAEFLETLRRSAFEFSRVDVTSALLRVGMEEETEDITLQMFAVKKRGSRGVLPDLRDAGDAWPEFCDY